MLGGGQWSLGNQEPITRTDKKSPREGKVMQSSHSQQVLSILLDMDELQPFPAPADASHPQDWDDSTVMARPSLPSRTARNGKPIQAGLFAQPRNSELLLVPRPYSPSLLCHHGSPSRCNQRHVGGLDFGAPRLASWAANRRRRRDKLMARGATPRPNHGVELRDQTDLCLSRLVESSLIQYLRWRPMPLWMALARLCHVTQRWLLGAPPLGAMQRSKGSPTAREAVMIRRQPAGAVASGIGRDAAGQFGVGRDGRGSPFLATSSPKRKPGELNCKSRVVGGARVLPVEEEETCLHFAGSSPSQSTGNQLRASFAASQVVMTLDGLILPSG
jgi:hypothetical protein